MDHVLYFVPRPHARRAEEALEAIARRVSPHRSKQIRVSTEWSLTRAIAKLRTGAIDGLVIDTRGEEGSAEDSIGRALMRAIFDEHDVASPIGRDRTWLVAEGGPRGAALAFDAGRLRLSGVLIPESVDASWEGIWERIVATVSRARGGKVALCLAGGGTEGLFYELGVLRALSTFLPSYDLIDVDIICGISAGALLGALLANGIGPEELARGLRGAEARFEPFSRSDIFDPNLGGFASRAMSLSWEVIRGRRTPLSALFRLPPAGLFAGKRLKQWVQRQLQRPGMVDRFQDLPHQLFIGATDQDTNEHVVFGAPGAPEVPIHVAVRASTALAPFYAPEEIDGRYYIDGGFTRTTNMRVAVQEGATLVILVDPLVPVASERPGHVAARGGIFVAMQGLKSLINGRLDKAVPTLRAMYPHVAFHLFQPGGAARRVMGGSPMKYFFREEIEEIAYRETVREIRTFRSNQLARDFQRHGIEFVDPDRRRHASSDEPSPVRVVA